MAIKVNPSAQPAGTRVSMVASAHTIVSATTRPRVSCHSATRHASVATDQAALHTYTSWYTHGSDAMYTSADPPSTDATITANPNASKRPTGAVPRISWRTSAVEAHERERQHERAEQHRRRREAAVESVGEQQQWHPQQRGKGWEVEVMTPAHHERLDAEASGRYVEVPVEQRPRLQVEEVRVGPRRGAAPQWVEPEVPQQGDERHQPDGGADDRGAMEATLGTSLWLSRHCRPGDCRGRAAGLRSG